MLLHQTLLLQIFTLILFKSVDESKLNHSALRIVNICTSSKKKVSCIIKRQKKIVNAIKLETKIQRGVDLFTNT